MEKNQQIENHHETREQQFFDSFIQDQASRNILDLNEYCLLEIFSNKSLTQLDLFAIAETCQRFQPVVQRVSPKEWNILYLERSRVIRMKGHPDIEMAVKDVDKKVKNFAPIVTTLTVEHRDCPSNELFNNVFVIEETDNRDTILENTFPLLEKFIFQCNRSKYSEFQCLVPLVIKFLQRHQTLKELLFEEIVEERYQTAFLQSIMELEKLTISELFCKPDFSQLQRLKYLKVTNFHGDATKFIVHLRELKSLMNLELHFERRHLNLELSNALAQLINLRQLTLDVSINYKGRYVLLNPLNFDVTGLIMQLTNLEMMTIYGPRLGDILTDEKMVEIVEIVESRPNLRIYFENDLLDFF